MVAQPRRRIRLSRDSEEPAPFPADTWPGNASDMPSRRSLSGIPYPSTLSPKQSVRYCGMLLHQDPWWKQGLSGAKRPAGATGLQSRQPSGIYTFRPPAILHCTNCLIPNVLGPRRVILLKERQDCAWQSFHGCPEIHHSRLASRRMRIRVAAPRPLFCRRPR